MPVSPNNRVSSRALQSATGASSGGPVIIDGREASVVEYAQRCKVELLSEMRAGGGVVLRNFTDFGEDALSALSSVFSDQLSAYEFGSTPRSVVGDKIYTSTEYPAHQSIPLHNEQSYTRAWPDFIWFHAMAVADQGGETPVADARKVFCSIDPAIRTRFATRQLRYVRNYGNGLDLGWEQVFETDNKASVERFCRERGLGFEWRDDDELRTWEVCQSQINHPRLGDAVWFNQAHLFHVTSLDEATRETLLSIVDEQDLPRNVYYGDGKPLEVSVLEEIRGAYEEEKRFFKWRAGDFLMLDNTLTAHGREPFAGERKIVVAMAAAH